jgi:hypothetical protein
MWSAPVNALASMMAARNVQIPFPAAVSQMPLPGLPSMTSDGLFTKKTAAWAAKDGSNRKYAKTPRRFSFRRIRFLNLISVSFVSSVVAQNISVEQEKDHTLGDQDLACLGIRESACKRRV